MKKVWISAVCLVLIAALAVGVFVISGTAAQTTLRVGYAMVDIMPETNGLPLGGYGNTSERRADNSLSAEWDKLKATAIAITDSDDNTAILISMDSIRCKETVVAAARRKIRWATDVPEDHIIVNASHTHSAPDVNSTVEEMYPYLDFMADRLAQAAIAAYEDRTELTEQDGMQYSAIETKGLNFTRHYYQSKVGYYGDNFGTIPGIKETLIGGDPKHTMEPDRTMYVLKFNRRENKDPVYLVNFRMHPHSQGSSTDKKVTADVIGAFRYWMAQKGMGNVAYFQGAAGMINSTSKLTSENWDKTTYASAGGYGDKMATYIANAAFTTIPQGKVKTLQSTYIGNTNRNQDDLYDIAKELQKIWTGTTGDSSIDSLNLEKRRDLYKERGAEYGLRSPYQGNAVVNRHNFPDQLSMELDMITIGNSVAISTAPIEMFHETSKWLENTLRTNGGYKLAMTFGYSNEHMSYVPSNTVWEYTSYETDISHWERGTAEDLVYYFCREMYHVSYTENCP